MSRLTTARKPSKLATKLSGHRYSRMNSNTNLSGTMLAEYINDSESLNTLIETKFSEKLSAQHKAHKIELKNMKTLFLNESIIFVKRHSEAIAASFTRE